MILIVIEIDLYSCNFMHTHTLGGLILYLLLMLLHHLQDYDKLIQEYFYCVSHT